MDESLLSFMTENEDSGPEVRSEDATVLDCEPPSERSIFNDPDVLEGRMTKATTVILLIIAIITIIINLGVIVRIYKVIKKGGDLKPAFYFIGNLAISDFLVGFYVIIVFCIDLTQFSTDWRDKCCGLLTAIVVAACQETIWNITLIAIDKYTFICHGLSYRTIVTKRRVWISILISWFTSLLIGFLPLFGMHEDDWCACTFLLYINKGFAVLLFLSAVILPTVVIFWMYSIILSLAIKVTRTKLDGTSSSSSGLTSVVRLSLKSSKSSKSTNSTLSSKISNTSSSGASQTSSSPESEPNLRTRDASDDPSEVTPLKQKLYKTLPGHKTSDLLTVVELPETDLTMPYEITSSADSDNVDGVAQEHKISARGLDSRPHKKGSYDLVNGSSKTLSGSLKNPDEKSVVSSASLQSYKQFDEDGNELVNTHTKQSTKAQHKSRNRSKRSQIHRFNSRTSSNGDETENDSSEDEYDLKRRRHWKRKSYYKRIAAETKDKVQFLQKCKAIKPILMIMFCFILTYVPFVIGAFAFKVQKEKNANLFKALNNWLYFAVVLNSLMNPFVYAYGYKEFRLRTKNFKGIFARERRPNR